MAAITVLSGRSSLVGWRCCARQRRQPGIDSIAAPGGFGIVAGGKRSGRRLWRTTATGGAASAVPDSRLVLGSPVARPRAEVPGGAVDCAIDVANQAEQMLSRLIVTCELLDHDGVPIGAGLGTAQNLASGHRQTVKTVVYGVRVFSNARAVVTQAVFQ